ncbi:MAG: hypothetical protein GYB65_11535 [Chloroflexi bacterium]|nr:hypothetical protein [Chloroflexota bacterium]
MYNDETPLPPKDLNDLTTTRYRGLRKLVHRARLERLAAELLRMGDALRVPVPIDRLFHNPPQRLWRIDPQQPLVYLTPPNEPLYYRLEIARAVARLTGEANWEVRTKLIGEQPFSASEVEVFALALLLPTALLANLNQQQRNVTTIAKLFQVPLPETTARLTELGYIRPPEDARPS